MGSKGISQEEYDEASWLVMFACQPPTLSCIAVNVAHSCAILPDYSSINLLPQRKHAHGDNSTNDDGLGSHIYSALTGRSYEVVSKGAWASNCRFSQPPPRWCQPDLTIIFQPLSSNSFHFAYLPVPNVLRALIHLRIELLPLHEHENPTPSSSTPGTRHRIVGLRVSSTPAFGR